MNDCLTLYCMQRAFWKKKDESSIGADRFLRKLWNIKIYIETKTTNENLGNTKLLPVGKLTVFNRFLEIFA